MFKKLIFFLLIAAIPLVAQEETTTAAATTTAAPAPTVIENVDSAQTREQLREILHRLPPQVGKTLKLDPTLWTNESYVSHYPALAAFIKAHPEVTHSPAYYLEGVWIPSDPVPETVSIRMWRDMIEMIMIFFGVAMTVGVFTWLIKTIVDHRRWSRLSRVQAEVHNKLMDRFTSNEDLLAYVKTTAGRRFLESAPIPLDAGPRAVSAPIGRVLWSVQAGIVLAAAGVGLTLMSWSVDKDVAQPMSAMGVLAIAIGIGFVIAAAISYVLSKKLGLLQMPASEPEASPGE